MQKLFLPLIVLVTLLFSCQAKQEHSHEEANGHEHHEEAKDEKKKPKSPRTNAMANIGSIHVHIDYSSPSVRGRTIWGGLVSYDQVWVTGAHKATSINFHGNVKINGQDIEKGKYAFFTIPSENEWTVIINKNFDQHLADDYDESQDILRFKVTPEQLDENQEALTYEVIPSENNKGQITMSWEKLRISFKVETLE